jgi:hypothetical protein
MHYDFDILHAGPGIGYDSQPRAVFRSEDTQAAAQTLPKNALAWLAGAGFVFDAKGSDLPEGYYNPTDELARLHIMQRLTATMKDYDIAKAGKDRFATFVIADFINAMAKALPAPLSTPANSNDPAPQIPGPFAGLRGQAAKDALAKAAPRGWRPKHAGMPFGMLALARRQGLLKLTLGTAFVYCAVLLYLYR